MTIALRLLERRLGAGNRYPAPPREIVERVLPSRPQRLLGEAQVRDLTVVSHFSYGAITGTLLVLSPGRPGALSGAAYGIVLWAAGYLGWIPAAGILRPATGHPPERNTVMIAVHAIWGAVTAITLGELMRARGELFKQGPIRDS